MGFWDLLKGFFGGLFSTINLSLDDFNAIETDIELMISNTKVEIDKLKNFKFDPHWKNRVINVPDAIDASRDLVEHIVNDFRDRIDGIRQPIHDLILLKQTFVSPDEGAHISGATRALDNVRELQTTLHLIAVAIHEAAELEDLFLEITDTIQGLDSIFLSQGSSRKSVTLTYKKRY